MFGQQCVCDDFCSSIILLASCRLLELYIIRYSLPDGIQACSFSVHGCLGFFCYSLFSFVNISQVIDWLIEAASCFASGPTFSKLLRKILRRFLIFGQCLTISGKTITRRNFAVYLLFHHLTTTSRNNVQHDAKKQKVLITIIIAVLFPNSRLVLCQIFSCDCPTIWNLPKIFLRSFESVGVDSLERSSPKWPVLCWLF